MSLLTFSRFSLGFPVEGSSVSARAKETGRSNFVLISDGFHYNVFFRFTLGCPRAEIDATSPHPGGTRWKDRTPDIGAGRYITAPPKYREFENAKMIVIK